MLEKMYGNAEQEKKTQEFTRREDRKAVRSNCQTWGLIKKIPVGEEEV